MQHRNRSTRSAARSAVLALIAAGLLVPLTAGLSTVLASPAQAALVKHDDDDDEKAVQTSSPKPTATASSTTVTTSKQTPAPSPTATRTRTASPSPTPTKTATAEPVKTATASPTPTRATTSPTPTRTAAPVTEPEERPTTQAIAPVKIPSTGPLQNLAPLAPVSAPVVQGPVVAGSPTRTPTRTVVSAPLSSGRSVTAPLARPVRTTVAALLAPVPSRSTALSAALQPLVPVQPKAAPLGAAIFDAPGDPAGMGPMPRPFGPSMDESVGPAAGPTASRSLNSTLVSSPAGPNGFALALLVLGGLLALYAVATFTGFFDRLAARGRGRLRRQVRRPLPVLPV